MLMRQDRLGARHDSKSNNAAHQTEGMLEPMGMLKAFKLKS